MQPEIVNEETKNFDRKLSKLVTKFKLSADLSRNYFTRHGLHMKNSGKEEITNRVVKAIRATQGKVHRKYPSEFKKERKSYTNEGITSRKIFSGKHNWHQECND
jgi:hypothetical protein